MRGVGPAVLRVTIGVIFAAHGAQKLFGMWGGSGLSGTAAYFTQLGLAPAYPLAAIFGIAELAGGLLLIAGAFTLAAAAVLAATMAVAIWKAHAPNGFFLNWTLTPGQGHGIEYDLALAAALVSLMLSGPGVLSVDGRRTRSAEAEAAGRARLRAGQV